MLFRIIKSIFSPWRLAAKLNSLLIHQERMMHTLAEVLSQVTAATTAVGGLKTLLLAQKQQIKDLIDANGGIPTGVQQQIDAVFDAGVVEAQAITDALAANVVPEVPPAQPPVDEPT